VGGPGSAASLALAALGNPSRERVRLHYSVPDAGVMSLGVYDVSGRLLRTLVGGKMAAGEHDAIWDGRLQNGERAASGVYFLRLQAHWNERVARIVLIN
jgi:flagellar hook assembly protein FlgD